MTVSEAAENEEVGALTIDRLLDATNRGAIPQMVKRKEGKVYVSSAMRYRAVGPNFFSKLSRNVGTFSNQLLHRPNFSQKSLSMLTYPMSMH